MNMTYEQLIIWKNYQDELKRLQKENYERRKREIIEYNLTHPDAVDRLIEKAINVFIDKGIPIIIDQGKKYIKAKYGIM